MQNIYLINVAFIRVVGEETMRSVKGVWLSSAAGIFAVTSAQAADLPVKAKPVEYVRVCSLYGAGFWYVPGTDTCIKIGAFVRANLSYNASGAGSPLGTATGPTGTDTASPGGQGAQIFAGRFDRLETDMFGFNNRFGVSVDTRTQTEYGTLRTYANTGFDVQSIGAGGGTTSVPNNGSYVDRAFIQFAGFTAGRIRSFFDIVAPGPFGLSGNKVNGDSSGTGVFGIAYTAQFGGGLSASISLEDGGYGGGGRGRSTVQLGPGTSTGGFSANGN